MLSAGGEGREGGGIRRRQKIPGNFRAGVTTDGEYTENASGGWIVSRGKAAWCRTPRRKRYVHGALHCRRRRRFLWRQWRLVTSVMTSVRSSSSSSWRHHTARHSFIQWSSGCCAWQKAYTRSIDHRVAIPRHICRAFCPPVCLSPSLAPCLCNCSLALRCCWSTQPSPSTISKARLTRDDHKNRAT